MGHFNEQYIADCDARTSDDDNLDRRDGVSSKPTMFTKSIEMQFAPAGKRTKFVGFIGQLTDERGIVLHAHLYATKDDARVALDALVHELLIDEAERGLVDTLPAELVSADESAHAPSLSQAIALGLVGTADPTCRLCGAPAFVWCDKQMYCQAWWQTGACVVDPHLAAAEQLAQGLANVTRVPTYVVSGGGSRYFVQCEQDLDVYGGRESIVATCVPVVSDPPSDPLPDPGPGGPGVPGDERPRARTQLDIQIEQTMRRNRLCPNCAGAHWGWQCPSIRKELLRDDTCKIQLANGRGVAIVDRADFDVVSRFSWYLHSQGYAATKIGGVTAYMHHFILRKIPTGHVVDHANGDKLDNQRTNLRTASKRQNNHNSKKRTGTISQYRGITRHPHRDGSKWTAYVSKDGKRIYLGSFENEIDAARAYDTAALDAHGEFAKLNFPNETPQPDVSAPEAAPWHDVALGRELCRMKWHNFKAFVALLLSVPPAHLIIYAASYQAFIREYRPDSDVTINQVLRAWTNDMRRGGDRGPAAQRLAA